MINLITIAQECPFYDGIAVYMARTGLSNLGLPIISNDCERTPPKQRSTLRLSNSESKSFKLYPNPAGQSFSIEYQVDLGENIEIELHDVLGKKVFAVRLGEGLSHLIQLDNMQQGLYLYRLIKEDVILESGKVIISD